MKKVLGLLAGMLLALAVLYFMLAKVQVATSPSGVPGSRAWPVPVEATERKNPVLATPESVRLGAMLYQSHCFLCHGEAGRGDGPWVEKLPVPPGDLADARLMRAMSDEELFWKISQGRGEMPRFENQLNEEQRWHLVNYVRTLSQRASAAPSD